MSQAIAAVGQIYLAGEFQKLFDKHNNYLSNWGVAQKLQFIKQWRNDIK